jgi:glycosyltransferase involved in cell wall biosynthesis
MLGVKNQLPAYYPIEFSVVIPYYNEAGYLATTLNSWLTQKKKPKQLILVNNGSSDRSEVIAKETLSNVDPIETVFIQEKKPGKLIALKKGLKHVSADYVALADADTYYPAHYLALCDRLFSTCSEDVSVLMALPASTNPWSFFSRIHRAYMIILHKIWKKHAFTGGYGQVFRKKALQKAGGFSEKYWPYVLFDHEIMFRIFKNGYSVYHINLWCQPSSRRRDRRAVRWNLFERLVYLFTPYPFQGWFFYQFLHLRFQKRQLSHLRLREQPWKK